MWERSPRSICRLEALRLLCTYVAKVFETAPAYSRTSKECIGYCEESKHSKKSIKLFGCYGCTQKGDN